MPTDEDRQAVIDKLLEVLGEVQVSRCGHCGRPTPWICGTCSKDGSNAYVCGDCMDDHEVMVHDSLHLFEGQVQ